MSTFPGRGGLPLLLPSAIGDFESQHIGEGIYLLTLRGTKYLDGTSWSAYVRLPVAHELLRMDLFHLTNANVKATSGWYYEFEMMMPTVPGLPEFLFRTIDDTIFNTQITEIFEKQFSLGTQYRIHGLNLTSTDRVYPFFYIRLLEGTI